MTSLNNRYPQFKPTTEQGIKLNEPGMKSGMKRSHFLKKKGAKIFKLTDGKMLVRFLPQINQSYFAYSTVLHYIGYDKSSFVCPGAIGQDCLVCEHRNKLFKEDNKDWENYKAQPTYLAHIIHRDHEDQGVQLWPMSEAAIKMFHKKLQGRNGEIRSIDNFDTGRDIEFTRGKLNDKVKFSQILDVEVDEPSVITTDVEKLDGWVKTLEDFAFPDCLNIISKERIRELMFGSTDPDNGPEVGSLDYEEAEVEIESESTTDYHSSEPRSEKPDLSSRLKSIKEAASKI
jgi:hypothetical protein